MKTMRKLTCLFLAMIMVLGLATAAMAVDVGGGNGKITITNAAKGVEYKIYKLFDATVSADGNIAYTGTIPDSLAAIFKVHENGQNIVVQEGKDTDKLTPDDARLLKTWAESQVPTGSGTGNGGELEFINVPYGYYVVTSTQGTLISVDSTNPEVSIVDKNTKDIVPVKGSNNTSYNIGDTITYTLHTSTTNYVVEKDENGNPAENAVYKQVKQYVISDTLPDWLEDVTVTAIFLDDDGDTSTKDDQTDLTIAPANIVKSFDENNAITIPWVNENGDSLYNNNTHIFVTYTAKLKYVSTNEEGNNDYTVIDGSGNKNTLSVQPYVDDNVPWEDPKTDTNSIYTYAAALKKVDNATSNPKALAGAEFQGKGLVVEEVSKGVYSVKSFDPNTTTWGTTMGTDDEGNLVILGLKSGAKVTIKETKAPDGYVLQTEEMELTPSIIHEEVTTTSTTTYYDEDGNETDVVTDSSSTVTTYPQALANKAFRFVNVPGTELPSTGGIGTTIFYVVGAILVLGAGVLLIAKKRTAKR